MFNATGQKTCSSKMFKTNLCVLNKGQKHHTELVQAIKQDISVFCTQLEHPQNMFKPDVQAKTQRLEHDSFPLERGRMFKRGAPSFDGQRKGKFPPRFSTPAYGMPRTGNNNKINPAVSKMALFIECGSLSIKFSRLRDVFDAPACSGLHGARVVLLHRSGLFRRDGGASFSAKPLRGATAGSPRCRALPPPWGVYFFKRAAWLFGPVLLRSFISWPCKENLK